MVRLAITLATALAVASPTAAQTTTPKQTTTPQKVARTQFNFALALLGLYIAGWECLRKRKTLDEAFLVQSMQDLGVRHFDMTKAEVGAAIKESTDQQLAVQARTGECVADGEMMILWTRYVAAAFIELGKGQR